jgi:hypothetical protein
MVAPHARANTANFLKGKYREDVNDLPPGYRDCIGWCQQTRGGRRRATIARTYLHRR